MAKWVKHALGASGIVLFAGLGLALFDAFNDLNIREINATERWQIHGAFDGFNYDLVAILVLAICLVPCVWIVFGVFLRDRYK